MENKIFEGFPFPKQNWSKLPHVLVDYLRNMTGAELKVVLYVLRHTWGFSEFGKPKRITLDEFSKGRKRKDQSRMNGGTGLSFNAIKDGIQKAVDHGFLIQIPDGRDGARHSYEYQLRMLDVSESDVSKSDTLLSKSDTRSEKETLERNTERENKDIEFFESFERHPESAFREENPEAIAVPTKKSSAIEEVARQLAPAIDWVWGSSDASDKTLLNAAEELLKRCGGDVDGTLGALDAYLDNPRDRKWAREDAKGPHWLLKSVAGQYQKVIGQEHRQSASRLASSAAAERSQAYREAIPELTAEERRWDYALDVLRGGVDHGTFLHLFAGADLVSLAPAVLEVRNEGVKEMLELRWAERVAEALGVTSVAFVI